MHQDDTSLNPPSERRREQGEVTNMLAKLYEQGERKMENDAKFHEAITHKFTDYFGELDGTTHKKHHSWVRDKITEEEAKDEFYKKIKYGLIEKLVMAVAGAIAMYIAVATFNSAAVDVVKAGVQQTQPVQKQ